MITKLRTGSSAVYGLVVVLGMTFYWPMFRNHYFGVLFTGQQAGSFTQNYTLLVILVIMAILAFMGASFSRQVLATLAIHRWLVPTFAVIASVMSCLLAAAPQPAAEQQALNYVAAFLLAAYMALVTIGWAVAVSHSRSRHVMLYLALSFFLSFVVALSTQWPFPLNLALPVVGPLVCGVCWYIMPPVQPPGQLSAPPSAWEPFSRRALSSPMLKTMLILVLFLLVGSVVRGVYATGVIDYHPALEGLARPLMSLALSLFLCLAVYFSAQRERLINVVWMVFVLLFFGGLFITAALVPASHLDSDIVVMSRTFLGFFLWIVITNVARSQRTEPIVFVCLFFLIIESLSGILTNYVIPALAWSNPSLMQENVGVLALLMAFILLLGSFGYLSTLAFRPAETKGGGALSGGAAPDAPDATKAAFALSGGATTGEAALTGEAGEAVLAQGAAATDARRAACERISKHSKLTARETEVLYLISQGHSIKRIAQSLYVSVGTTQTHVKSLYRKTGHHSRQEIIDFVNEEKQL